MQCPRCRTTITAPPDPGGSVVCPGCGARLTTRPAAKNAAPRTTDPGPAPSGDSATMRSGGPPAPRPGSATLPPGTPLNRKVARPGEDTARTAAAREAASTEPASLELVLSEVRALRRMQEQILELLQDQPATLDAPAAAREPLYTSALDEPASPRRNAVRSQQQKSVVVIDDDADTRAAAVAELEKAAVPVVAVADGNAGLEVIASQKPDVIVLELDLPGNFAGKDVINMIKATMEWVDIPIVLYTRMPIESQREARQIHGADEIVSKSSGAAALVTRVVSLFRRG
jgi:CheY-like chemotaxis protein